MKTSAFADRSYRLDRDGQTVVCDTTADRDDVDALRDALARRRHGHSVAVCEDAGAVLALREIVLIEDRLAAANAGPDPIGLSISRPEALRLCDVAGAYVTERDGGGYQAPEERRRIARLRDLTGALMDCCCELASAEEQVRERTLVA